MTHSKSSRRAALAIASLLAVALSALTHHTTASAGNGDGIVHVKSAYSVDDTVTRLQKDIESKGIKFFAAIDQAELGKSAGIELQPSTLLVFGNPPLGIQFLTANPNAGLDWPVRLLVTRDAGGQVWASYTDFAWIARRHGITSRDAQFKMASEVIQSITSSIAAK